MTHFHCHKIRFMTKTRHKVTVSSHLKTDLNHYKLSPNALAKHPQWCHFVL